MTQLAFNFPDASATEHDSLRPAVAEYKESECPHCLTPDCSHRIIICPGPLPNMAFGGCEPDVDTRPWQGVSWDEDGNIIYPEQPDEDEEDLAEVVPIKPEASVA